MPRVLVNPSGSIDYSNLEYGVLMKFAYISGWKPAGTLEPVGWSERTWPDGLPRPWRSMNYFSRLGQRVTDEDAAAMADTLEAVVDDVPGHDALAHKVGTIIDLPFRRRIRLIKPGVYASPFEFFSGENKPLLYRHIEFCRGGGYTIH
jgi:hypothetical protein